jgi:hypothetical protein
LTIPVPPHVEARIKSVTGHVDEQIGKLATEVAGLRREVTAFRTSGTNGHANLNGRIDGLATRFDTVVRTLEELKTAVEAVGKEIDAEVRPKLDSLVDDAEISAGHLLEQIQAEAQTQERVNKISIVVGKLRRERERRVVAERDAVRYKRLAKRVAMVAICAAAATIAASSAAALLNRCGVPVVEVPKP